MKVVTKIRSKNQVRDSQISNEANEDAKVTMDFNNQADLRAVSVDGMSGAIQDTDLVEVRARHQSGPIDQAILATAQSIKHNQVTSS